MRLSILIERNDVGEVIENRVSHAKLKREKEKRIVSSRKLWVISFERRGERYTGGGGERGGEVEKELHTGGSSNGTRLGERSFD